MAFSRLRPRTGDRLEKLWREPILAAQPAGLTILGPQQDRTRSWARDQAAVETYPAVRLEVQTADNPRRLQLRQ